MVYLQCNIIIYDEEDWDATLLVKLLLAVVLISLMGIAPHPHRTLEYLQLARHSWESGNPASAAANLAQAAEDFPWQPALWEKAGLYALQAAIYTKKPIIYLTKADTSVVHYRPADF
jgi:hypothetical protein